MQHVYNVSIPEYATYDDTRNLLCQSQFEALFGRAELVRLVFKLAAAASLLTSATA